MLTRTLIDTAEIPGGGVLRLMQRGDEFSIMLGANELMNSRLSGSEEALATMSLDRLSGVSEPHLLIGGLGMGFTLRAALASLGPDAQVTVAELVPEVVDWARGPMGEISGGSLDDFRVDIRIADVGDMIRANRGAYHAILLDVDNGPDGLTHECNEGLYDRKGLQAAKAALRPGGLLSIWSAAPHPRFAKRLRDTGFIVEEVRVRARGGGRGAHHIIWFAKA
ncbi:spermidine synthase [Parasphingopyxis lamellibrachiae]|uniref:Spermidine synthase n=1 Tax=Parasphingopyxis lamellibrachiae TaxID=680125 RepID=A0A3D9FD51_9SPHN|nr:spermidine synthase [Parasphingopyxis lamellibrachiae]RED15755.1 spermidine synthase [Parasphingopyxis lamellibrachiae]